jgi:hypothetical protein
MLLLVTRSVCLPVRLSFPVCPPLFLCLPVSLSLSAAVSVSVCLSAGVSLYSLSLSPLSPPPQISPSYLSLPSSLPLSRALSLPSSLLPALFTLHVTVCIRWLKTAGCGVFTMSHIDRWGIGRVMEMALDHLLKNGERPIHLSFDIDSVDPIIAPSTGTLVRGGLSYREAHYCVEVCVCGHETRACECVRVSGMSACGWRACVWCVYSRASVVLS